MNDPSRKPVPRRLRFEILRRDNYTCRYCGATAPEAVLTVDHVIPVALGGGDEPNNLCTACKPCNEGKASTSPDEHTVEDVDAAAMLFAKAMEKASEMRRQSAIETHAAAEWFKSEWDSWKTQNGKGDSVPLDPKWRSSYMTFLERGLDEDDLLGFISVAMERGVSIDETWRYFCGCCWRELTNRTEMARRLIEDGEV